MSRGDLHACADPTRRTRVLVTVALLASLFAVFMATAPRGYASIDTLSSDVAAWRIATTGTPWFDDIDRSEIGDFGTQHLWWRDTGSGHTTIARSPGSILVSVPAYAAARMLPEGEDFSLRPAQATAASLMVIAMLFLLWSLAGLLPFTTRVIGIGAVALTTPVWAVAADNVWTHTVTIFGLSGMAWSARRDRWWLVGLFGGVALWGRLHTALIVAILGLAIAAFRRRPGTAVRIALPSLVLMALAMWWSHWMYGTWNPAGPYGTPEQYATGAAERGAGSYLENLARMLVSPDRGLLVWTPALLLLGPTALRHWRSSPDWMRALAAGGVCYLLAQAAMNTYTGGDAFWGYRLPLETVLCLCPLLVVTAVRLDGIGRHLLGPILGWQLVVIALGALADHYPSVPKAWGDNQFLQMAHAVPAVWLAVLVVVALVTIAAEAAMRVATVRPPEIVGAAA